MCTKSVRDGHYDNGACSIVWNAASSRVRVFKLINKVTGVTVATTNQLFIGEDGIYCQASKFTVVGVTFDGETVAFTKMPDNLVELKLAV